MTLYLNLEMLLSQYRSLLGCSSFMSNPFFISLFLSSTHFTIACSHYILLSLSVVSSKLYHAIKTINSKFEVMLLGLCMYFTIFFSFSLGFITEKASKICTSKLTIDDMAVIVGLNKNKYLYS